tara:strand:- start:469 stop:1101 length:633 start_codon:yes stop_codon:yes gene_type:complete
MLKLENITLKIFGEYLFSPISVEILGGQITTVMGPSGCGKSSLLSYLCGTLSSEISGSGKIIINGKDVQNIFPHLRKFGILFQDDLLFPHLSVGENLAFALPTKFKKKERYDKILIALEEIELSGMYDRDPATLSGGQKVRVALMRTLLSEPKALLLDEPFAKLDQGLRERFRYLVFEHAKRYNLPTLLVTHDYADARAAEGKIIFLKKT